MRHRHGEPFHVARLAVGLRLDAFDHALVGQLVVELDRRIAVADHVGMVGIVDHFVVHLQVGAGRHTRQPRPHVPAVGKHRVALLGEELLLPEHVLDRMDRRLVDGCERASAISPKGTRPASNSTMTKPTMVFMLS